MGVVGAVAIGALLWEVLREQIDDPPSDETAVSSVPSEQIDDPAPDKTPAASGGTPADGSRSFSFSWQWLVMVAIALIVLPRYRRHLLDELVITAVVVGAGLVVWMVGRYGFRLLRARFGRRFSRVRRRHPRLRRWRPIGKSVAILLVGVLFLGGVGWAGWWMSHGYDLSADVVLDDAARTIDIRRNYLIGHSSGSPVPYDAVRAIRFTYVDADEGGFAVLELELADGGSADVTRGAPCPVRELADQISDRLGVHVEIEPEYPEFSSLPDLYTVFKCAQPEQR